jgi:hypothetical protein
MPKGFAYSPYNVATQLARMWETESLARSATAFSIKILKPIHTL